MIGHIRGHDGSWEEQGSLELRKRKRVHQRVRGGIERRRDPQVTNELATFLGFAQPSELSVRIRGWERRKLDLDCRVAGSTCLAAGGCDLDVDRVTLRDDVSTAKRSAD